MLGSFVVLAKDTGQKIFRENVKSLKVWNPDNFLAPPILNLNSNDRLIVSFDILSDSPEYLRYRLIHCNSDWQPSGLLENEFLGGFNETSIEDFAFSENTYVHFINYQISLPDPALPILKSGNYLIQVYPEDSPDDILLQERFYVSEDITNISASASAKTDKGYLSDWQQLDLQLSLSHIPQINPYQDLEIVVSQNNRPESVRHIKHPSRVQSGVAVFEHSDDLIFEAGNEFRRFETVRTDYPGMNVDSVKFKDGVWHAWLRKDLPRDDKNYFFDKTQNGRFKIDEYNSTDPDLGADYIMVHFSLVPPDTNIREIFLQGEFTQNNLDNASLMRYAWNDGLYHADLLLKQGSYNYQYVALLDQSGQSDPSPIEGNKYETQNEYLVLVYFRPPGARADRLVSSSQFFFQP